LGFVLYCRGGGGGWEVLDGGGGFLCEAVNGMFGFLEKEGSFFSC
jgi:hypothetical protein